MPENNNLILCNVEDFAGTYEDFVANNEFDPDGDITLDSISELNISEEWKARLKALSEKVVQVGKTILHIGRVIIKKLCDFISLFPHMETGMVASVFLYVIASAIPIVGQVVAFLFKYIFAILSVKGLLIDLGVNLGPFLSKVFSAENAIKAGSFFKSMLKPQGA